MRQLTFTARGKLRWDEVPDAQLVNEDDAVVRPIVASRCDLDTLLLNGFGKQLRWGMRLGMIDPCVCRHFGPHPFAGPYPFGHECVAAIEECGPGVRRFSPGQLVVVPFQVSCGACAQCRIGLTGLCASVPNISAFGMGLGWGGALSDRLRVPFADAMLVAVPEGVTPLAVASAADNLSDAWRLVAPALEQRPGADVLIAGGRCASVGLYAVALALALGASEVHYMDVDRGRLQIAEKLGALPVERLPSGEASRTYTVVVDATASRRGLMFGLRSTGSGGMFSSAGIYFFKGTKVPLFAMYARGVSLMTGLPNVRAVLPKVLDLVRTGRLRPELVTTQVATWEDAPEAFCSPTAKVMVART